MKKIISFVLFFLIFGIFAQDFKNKSEKYVSMNAALLKINGEPYLVLDYQNEPKWHTYWKNPGDAGLTFTNKFFLSENNNDKDITELFIALEWPSPKTYMEPGDILAYGHEGNYQFFYKVQTANLASISNKKLKIQSRWLVCKDICIPEQQILELHISPEGLAQSDQFQHSVVYLQEQLNALPQEASSEILNNLEINLVLTGVENELGLHYSFKKQNSNFFILQRNLLTPFPVEGLGFKHEKLVWDAKTLSLYGRMLIDWEGMYLDPPREIPENKIFDPALELAFLLFDFEQQRSWVIKKKFEKIMPSSDTSYLQLMENFTKISQLKNDNSDQSSLSMNEFFIYLLFAFLGGFILNFMPCVLPVISLKLFGLVNHAHQSKKIIAKHNLVYSLGILVTFWILASVVALLKMSGEAIGWGFQLQSPSFVALMVILIFIMALNLFGLFEFRVPGGSKIGNISLKESFFGDFFSGVLATILSTPCSAPFLGVALGFAFSQSLGFIFLIFTFIALGLASPFLMVALFPQWTKIIPRPGVWMEKLKYFLGFSLLLTGVWLIDVFFSLVDVAATALILMTLLSLIFFMIFSYRFISQKLPINALYFLIILSLAVQLQSQLQNTAPGEFSSASKSSNKTLWSPWSVEKMQLLEKEKKWVFIDFTASWCLTCKVNKKLVLDTEEFLKYAKDLDLQLLVGDWSKSDPKITAFLESYKIAGVPAYFLQSPEGKIHFLGETISLDKIKKIIQH